MFRDELPVLRESGKPFTTALVCFLGRDGPVRIAFLSNLLA